MTFYPLPVSTLGGWHKEAAITISRLGGILASATGREKEEVIRHLFQRLSVQLMKGNAALLLSRVPTFASPEVDGDLDNSDN